MHRSEVGRGDRENGASAVEYALLLAGIAGILAIVIYALGGQTGPMFGDTCDSINTEMSGSATCS